MRLALIILFVINLKVSAVTYAQNVTISKPSISLKDAFSEIRQQTGYFFIYNNEIVNQLKPISIHVRNATIDNALKELLKNQPLEYSIEDKVIIIKPKKVGTLPSKQNQTRRITGKVVDENDGEPLIGVTVKLKGSLLGAITNVNGEFTINAGPNDKALIFTYIGYANKQIEISETSSNYNVSLSLENTQLQEVVVAFGSTSKRELTNSVAQVTAKDIEQRPINNLNSALVGAAPGVQSTSGSGQPGQGPSIVVRGFGSVTGNNNPLYILDGAPYDGDISNINPDDIENISVLKDAASTALYGSRAANGVVLITSKRGKRNSSTINFSANTAFSTRSLPDYDKVDAYQYFPLIWESLRNGALGNPRDASLSLKSELGWNPFNVADDEIVSFDGTLNPKARLLHSEDLSFRDEMQRIGVRKDMSLSLSGGGEKSDHYISLNYLDDKGYVIGSDFKRFSAKVNVNAQPAKWLTTGLNMYGNYTDTEQANENSGINENPFYIDLVMAPIYPVYLHDPVTGAYLLDENGNRQYDAGDYRPVMTGRNVIAETKYNINNVKRTSITSNGYVEANFLRDFKFRSNISATIYNYRNNVFDSPLMGDAYGAGRMTFRKYTTTSYNFNQLLTYNKTFADKHKVTFLAGHENYLYNYDTFLSSKRGLSVFNSDPVLDNFSVNTGTEQNEIFYATEGYLSKLDYGYDGRYLVSGAIRRDGSSRFADGKRWGNFWSASAAWNIDRESFFKVKWIDLLRLRGSFGKVGNDDVGIYYAHQGLYTLNRSNGYESGATYTKIATPELVWETNSSADVAVEFGLFDSRLNGTVEYYERTSDNLLFQVTMPVTAGPQTKYVNFGSMRNKGIEIQLSGDVIRKKDFNWNMIVNFSTLSNKILSLPSQYEGRITGNRIFSTGQSLYEFWVREFYGIDPDTGNELFYAANSSTASSRVFKGTDTLTSSGATDNVKFHYAGSAIPDFYGSINNVLTYKNFSFQLMFLYQVGGRVFDTDYQSLMHRGTIGRSLHVDALNRWQNPGDITNVPRRSTGTTMYASDRFLTNASYLNLRTAALTYNLPKTFTAKFGSSAAKVFVNGENLFITSARKGMDPTQTYQGDPSYTYAPSRIISFGLNVTL